MKYIDFSDLSHFTEKQKEALSATKQFRFVLYGGTMGSGKSYFLRWACIYWLMYLGMKYKQKGVRAGLFCEDYGALNDRHISKLKYEFPKKLGTYNDQRHEFTLNPMFGSGVLAFRNLDDPSKFVSSEFAVIAVDEVSRDEFSAFSILRTRLRWPGVAETRFFAASNPVGEPWVKRYWIDKNFPSEEKEGDQFFFVPARPTDNPYLSQDYFKGLESLDEQEKKAYLDGDWNAFEKSMDSEGYMKLITDAELQNAIVNDPSHVGNLVLGVDPAAGGDRSSVVLKSETCQEIVFNQKLNDVMQLVSVVGSVMDKYRDIKQIIVDKTGLGEGVYRRLKEIGYPVKGVSFSESPSDTSLYENIKAELYWKERKWLLGGGRLVKNHGWNDFMNIKYKKQSDRKVRIQSKSDLRSSGFKSPDAVDAAVLTMHASKNLDFKDLYGAVPFKDKTNTYWK